MRVFIVGYMGSGKTSFGKKLAAFLGYKHLDLDQQIVEEDGRAINQIFEEEGELYFRKLEHHRLEALSNEDNCVISTGGGAAVHQNNMALMKSKGVTVYMQTTAKALYSRLKQGTQERPILKGLDETGLYHFIEEHLKKRHPVYNEAHIKVDSLQWKQLNLEQFKTELEAVVI